MDKIIIEIVQPIEFVISDGKCRVREMTLEEAKEKYPKAAKNA